MVFSGLQKLTLLDYPGVVACILFTRGCNFRCPYCHNAALVLPDEEEQAFDEEEIVEYLKKRSGILEGIVVTGGEPLLHKELPATLARFREMGFKIKLDTNGTSPDRLRELVDGGLVNRVAMDVKSSPEGYTSATGIENPDLAAITRSRDLLLEGRVDYEFRTTVVKGIHTEQDLIGAAKWLAGAKEYYLQQFKNSGGLICADGLEAFTPEEMEKLADAVRVWQPNVRLRGI